MSQFQPPEYMQSDAFPIFKLKEREMENMREGENLSVMDHVEIANSSPTSL